MLLKTSLELLKWEGGYKMALITHKVVWGDTLWALGKKYGVDYMEIARIYPILV